MQTLITVFTFVLGTIVGSFLNVIALRFNTGFGIKGRSQCFSCGYTLEWLDLIPVLSFLTHRGKCRKCKSPISYQYPLVEVMTGALFALLFYKFQADYLLLIGHILILCILTVAFIYDVKHKIIPNSLSYSFIILAAIVGMNWWGILVSVPFWLIVLLSKERWMGGGDAKLSMGIGLLLGVSGGISALVLATWIGAVVGIPLLFIKKKGSKIKHIEIPFAPFLIIGMYLALFSGIDLFYVSSLIQ